MDLSPGQSLCKALKILKIYSCRDAKISRAKPSSRLANLPGARLLMKPLEIHVSYASLYNVRGGTHTQVPLLNVKSMLNLKLPSPSLLTTSYGILCNFALLYSPIHQNSFFLPLYVFQTLLLRN